MPKQTQDDIESTITTPRFSKKEVTVYALVKAIGAGGSAQITITGSPIDLGDNGLAYVKLKLSPHQRLFTNAENSKNYYCDEY